MNTPDYEIQATPMTIRDLGWEFLQDVCAEARPSFVDDDFRPLRHNPDGSSVPGFDGRAKVMIADLSDAGLGRMLVVPYLDDKKTKVLYCKYETETFLDSVSAPDGMNKV